MKSKINGIIFTLLILLFFIFISNPILITNNKDNLTRSESVDTVLDIKTVKTSGFWNRNPFIIDNDDQTGDYNWSEASQENWCRGSGNWSDPYILENITVDGLDSGHCIEIRDSDVYFIINNCTFYNSSGVAKAGIYLNNVNNGTIKNNNCSNNEDFGMSIHQSNNITITNNYVSNNGQFGINLDSCLNSILEGNFVISNSIGITLDNTNSSQILKNIMKYNSGGLLVNVGGSNNNITENIFLNNTGGGFQIQNGQNNLAYNNYFSNPDGFNALGSTDTNHWNNSKLGNYWADYAGADNDNDGIGDTSHAIDVWNDDYKPIMEPQFFNGSLIHVDDSGVSALNWSQTALVKWWCSGSGTVSEPYIIENLEIDGKFSGSCIKIENSDKLFEIKNCTLFNSAITAAYGGITLENTNNSVLIGNNCSNNGQGIFLSNNCDNNTIIGNIVKSNNLNGIRVWNLCDENNITKNIFENNGNYGVYTYQSCSNNTILKNNASYNSLDGIRLYDNSNYNLIFGNIVNDNENFGIHLRDNCQNNTISGNIAMDTPSAYTQDRGIYLFQSCLLNKISMNNITGNNENGIHFLTGCNNNTIKSNLINNNTLHGVYLVDDCDNNNFTENTIANNTDRGVYIDDNTCTDNLFYQNYFIGNGKHAWDDSDPGDNHWDNGEIGNYWDNYTGKDLNDNLIGDTAYNFIFGNAGAQDNYPIWDDGPDINGKKGDDDEDTPPSDGGLLIIIIISIVAIIGILGVLLFIRKNSRPPEEKISN